METPTVIIDNGSGFIKAGTNTDSLPSVFFPTVVGFPRRRFLHLFNDKPSQEKIFIGDKAVENRHQLTIVNPIDHGHIDDWEQMAYVWQHVYDVLGLNPSEHPCLLTEPPNCSSTHRNKLAETLFEGFDAPEVCLGVTGLMAIYGTGQTTGLVVDIGEGVTQCVPVFDGYLEASSLRRSDFGGEELQMYLQKILCDMGYQMTTRDDYEHVRVIKETLCFCSLDPASDQQRTDLDRTYHLPDGLTLRDGETTEITLGPERFYPAEALFNPQLCGRDNPSLTDLIWSSVKACPMENRKSLVASVVLCGGSSMFPGFPERLEQELKNTAPPKSRSIVSVSSPKERQFLVWVGAKTFTDPSLRPMQDHLWITKAEWEEVGPRIVAQKAAIKTSGS